jgi:hypothetical protein
METNELIERYVREVGRHLPRNKRADIELELSSLLHDALEERAATAGKEPSLKMAADVLREFGKPEVIAGQYRPEQYLIGPQLFPIYKLVLTIVLVIISVIHVAGLVFMLLRGETAVFGQTAWNWFSSYFQSAALNVGILTLIFAAIEQAQIINLPERAPAAADWDPISLPPVKDPDRINRFELGFGMLWTVAFIILFNFYPERIGIINISGGEVETFRLLAPAFAVHIPWLTVLWTLELGLKSIVLAKGRWSRLTRWLELALVPLNIYILNRIRTGGEIFTIAGLTTLFKLGLALVIVIVVLDGLHKLYRLLMGRPFLSTENIKSRFA